MNSNTQYIAVHYNESKFCFLICSLKLRWMKVRDLPRRLKSREGGGRQGVEEREEGRGKYLSVIAKPPNTNKQLFYKKIEGRSK